MNVPVLCRGVGMKVCESCWRNADGHDVIPAYHPFLSPCIDPPRCADWLAAPAVAKDVSHGRL